MMILGITGPSGAGKGTACTILEKHGFYHIDTDRLVPGVYPDAVSELKKAFGPTVIRNGSVDKKALAQIAFSSSENTEKLNAIIHPRVIEAVRNEIRKAETIGVVGVTVDGAALFEAHADALCDRVLCILSPRSKRLFRVLLRDGIPEEDVQRRFDAQKPDTYYSSRADDTIINEDLDQFEHDLDDRIKEWLS